MGRPATLRIDILADAKGVGKGVAEAESKLGKLGGGAKTAGLAIGAGLAAGAVAVGAFAAGSVRAASEVEQSFGAVESVFGKAAGQVKQYAEGAATNLGLAKSEYASLSAVVGSQLQGMGKSQAEAATESHKLIGMGADLAATFGGSVSDAVGAVGSLLRGERDPIEKYGVALKAADIEARLAANGQDKLTGAARKTAEANATLELLTEKTKNSFGAFGRESNTLAGQQERLKAQFENVKATVGAGLTPILTGLFTVIGTKVLPVAQQMGKQIAEKLGPILQQLGAWVQSTVLPAFTRLADYWRSNVGPVTQVLGGFVTGVLLPAFTAVANYVTTKVVPAFITIGNAVLPALRQAFTTVSNAVDSNRTELTKLGGFVSKLAGLITPLASVVGTVLATAFRTAGTAISAILDILGAVVRAAESAADAIRAVARVASSVGSAVGKLNPFSVAPLAPMGVPLAGGGPALSPGAGGLATAALSPSSWSTLGRSGMGLGGVTVVDRRTIDASVRVEAMLLDDRVVDRINRAQLDQARRLGSVPATGVA